MRILWVSLHGRARKLWCVWSADNLIKRLEMNMEHTGELTLSEKRNAMISALSKLDEQDQEKINNIVNDLVRRIKLKSPTIQFSYESGVELVARLGQFLVGGVR